MEFCLTKNWKKANSANNSPNEIVTSNSFEAFANGAGVESEDEHFMDSEKNASVLEAIVKRVKISSIEIYTHIKDHVKTKKEM